MQSPGHAQRCLAADGPSASPCRPRRHRRTAESSRQTSAERCATWRAVTGTPCGGRLVCPCLGPGTLVSGLLAHRYGWSKRPAQVIGVKRQQVSQTDDRQQLRLLAKTSEQRTHERIRPVVFFGPPASVRARETGAGCHRTAR